jgi:hypothetical protein
MGPFFLHQAATFGWRVARRPRLRGAGAGAIGSGAGASRRSRGAAGSSNRGAMRSDRGELATDRGGMTVDRGELATDRGELAGSPGNSSARSPAHGRCQVKRSQSAVTITQAMKTPMARAVDSIAGAQSA